MHFAARSALLASCLALRVHALPVTYSVVDVDGGSAAGGDVNDSQATVYHTVTKSSEVKEPEATTVSVTIVSTADASPKSTNASEPSSTSAVSTSSPSPSMKASAQASSSTSSPAPADKTDGLSVLESVMSTYSTQKASSISSPLAKPTNTDAPSPPAAAPHSDDSDDEDCVAASVTVTATTESASAQPQGETVTLRSTTTVTPAAAPTSYYDDGMWHTRYAIKPSAAPEPAPKVDEAAPKHEEKSAPVLPAAANATSPSTNATLNARRQVEAIAPTSTLNQAVGTGSSQVVGTVASGAPIVGRQIHGSPAFGEAAGTGAPEMLVHPFRPQATGIAARAQPTGFVTGLVARAESTGFATGLVARAEPTGYATGVVARAEPSGFATGIIARAQASGIAARALQTGDAAADDDVLLADAGPTAAGIVGRAVPTGYSVVSWNETMQA